MKLIPLQTGKVRIKKNQITRKQGPLPSMINIFSDKIWSEWLPIYAWVIVHDEGVIIVDAGETSKTKAKKYLPKWHPYYSFAVDFDVKPEDEIGPQLIKMGINPKSDVSKVVLTHLHTDHAGGLHHFPNAEIIFEKNEFYNALGFKGMLRGYLPHRWPNWLDPTLVELPSNRYGSFSKSLPLTSDKKVMLVSTSGHVANHISVIVEKEGLYYFLAGDTSYNQENLMKELPDGIGTKQSIATLRNIKSFSTLHPTIYLPSHDPQVPARMENKEIVPCFYQIQEEVYSGINNSVETDSLDNTSKQTFGYWETMAMNN